jgi:hypothetical protein
VRSVGAQTIRYYEAVATIKQIIIVSSKEIFVVSALKDETNTTGLMRVHLKLSDDHRHLTDESITGSRRIRDTLTRCLDQ